MQAPQDAFDSISLGYTPHLDHLEFRLYSISQLNPRDSITRIWQRLVCWLKQPKVIGGEEKVFASLSTIPLALCLLIRFRKTDEKAWFNDNELTAASIMTSYKILIDWSEGSRNQLSMLFEINKSRLQVVEHRFLEAFDHKV